MKKTPLAVVEGTDPEIMHSVLSILQAAGANLEIHPFDAHKTQVVLNGSSQEISLGTYVTIYPCVSYAPYIATQRPDVNVVIIRERAEDLYMGMEYPETPDLCIATKLTSRAGSEKAIRYAFEYAKSHRRKKVTVLVQERILKVTDGLFHKIFKQVAEDYPDILNESLSVDVGAENLAQTPEIFDVIVTSNLYGDILSNIMAIPRDLKFSANIGDKGAVFEATGFSGLLLASLQMLEYLGESSLATHIYNAWAYALEQGLPEEEKIIQSLGKGPKQLQPPLYHQTLPTYTYTPALISGRLVGIDVYIYFRGHLSEFFSKISHINVGPLRLKAIFNRGTLVWPNGADTFCVEEWCCRFLTEGNKAVVQDDLIKILHAVDHMQISILRTVCLSIFPG